MIGNPLLGTVEYSGGAEYLLDSANLLAALPFRILRRRRQMNVANTTVVSAKRNTPRAIAAFVPGERFSGCLGLGPAVAVL